MDKRDLEVLKKVNVTFGHHINNALQSIVFNLSHLKNQDFDLKLIKAIQEIELSCGKINSVVNCLNGTVELEEEIYIKNEIMFKI